MNEKKKNPPQSNNEKEILHLKYSYDRTLEIFKLNNDNYFKRTQIIMVALQIGLFIVLMRLLSPLPDSSKDFPLPIIVTLLGAVIAVLWIVFMNKQNQYLELQKRYLRNLEMKLVRLGVPMDYFSIESAATFEDIDEKKVIKINKNIKGKKIETDNDGNRFVHFKWSDDWYPDKKEPVKSKRAKEVQWLAQIVGIVGIGEYKVHAVGNVKGGLVKTEERLSKGAFWFWSILFVSLIVWLFYCLHYSPCSC